MLIAHMYRITMPGFSIEVVSSYVLGVPNLLYANAEGRWYSWLGWSFGSCVHDRCGNRVTTVGCMTAWEIGYEDHTALSCRPLPVSW